MRRITSRRSGPTSTRASSTTAGTPIASRCSSGRSSWASCRKDAELSRHDPDVQDWQKLPADERKLYARMMEVFAGFLEHTDHHIGRLIVLSRAARGTRQHAHHGDLRQRRERRGRPDGLGQREQVLQQRAGRSLEQNLAAIDDLGGPKYFNHYAWGWTIRRQHAVPALEARDLSRRRQRSVHRALAQRHQGEGRDSHPVRARHRHGAHGARVPWDRAAESRSVA